MLIQLLPAANPGQALLPWAPLNVDATSLDRLSGNKVLSSSIRLETSSTLMSTVRCSKYLTGPRRPASSLLPPRYAPRKWMMTIPYARNNDYALCNE